MVKPLSIIICLCFLVIQLKFDLFTLQNAACVEFVFTFLSMCMVCDIAINLEPIMVHTGVIWKLQTLYSKVLAGILFSIVTLLKQTLFWLLNEGERIEFNWLMSCLKEKK